MWPQVPGPERAEPEASQMGLEGVWREVLVSGRVSLSLVQPRELDPWRGAWTEEDIVFLLFLHQLPQAGPRASGWWPPVGPPQSGASLPRAG